MSIVLIKKKFYGNVQQREIPGTCENILVTVQCVSVLDVHIKKPCDFYIY